MRETIEYRFKIRGVSRESLPMVRLGELMTLLAKFLGHKEHVHFDRLEQGSAVLVHTVEANIEPEVEKRIFDVSINKGVIPLTTQNDTT